MIVMFVLCLWLPARIFFSIDLSGGYITNQPRRDNQCLKYRFQVPTRGYATSYPSCLYVVYPTRLDVVCGMYLFFLVAPCPDTRSKPAYHLTVFHATLGCCPTFDLNLSTSTSFPQTFRLAITANQRYQLGIFSKHVHLPTSSPCIPNWQHPSLHPDLTPFSRQLPLPA